MKVEIRKEDIPRYIKKFWDFIWHGKSIWSYIAFFIFAYIVYHFAFMPILYHAFGITEIAAVVSDSMQHENPYTYERWLKFRNISNEGWPFPEGINMGDVIIVKKVDPKELKVGDVVLYYVDHKQIVHRIVYLSNDSFTTKGDNNPFIMDFEKNVSFDKLKGKVILRIPYLGIPRVAVMYVIGI